MRLLKIICIVVIVLLRLNAMADTNDWKKYKDYKAVSSNVQNVMDEMVIIANKNGAFNRIVDVGQTAPVMPGYPPEDIKAILISKGAGTVTGNTTGKPAVIITGAIHANEWISVEVALRIADYLVSNATNTAPLFGSKQMTIKKLLENVEVVVIPVLNPAGYRYSRNEHNRAAGCTTCSPYNLDNELLKSSCTLTYKNQSIIYDKYCGYSYDPNQPRYADWRKNRRNVSTDAGGPGDAGMIFGVDLNRNFPPFWGSLSDSGSSNPWDYGGYRGSSAGSEKETAALRSLYEIQSRKVKAQIDFHSSDILKVIAYPWAYTTAAISDEKKNLRPDSNT